MERVIQFYRNAAGSCPVQELLDELDDRTLAKILAVFQLIECQPMVPVQYFKKLSGQDLWECRVGLGRRIFRFLGFWGSAATIVITHGFQKKTQKTPPQQIEKALNLKADWERRNERRR